MIPPSVPLVIYAVRTQESIGKLFIIQKLAKDLPCMETTKGVMPFLASDFVRIGFLVFFPALSLDLVQWMG